MNEECGEVQIVSPHFENSPRSHDFEKFVGVGQYDIGKTKNHALYNKYILQSTCIDRVSMPAIFEFKSWVRTYLQRSFLSVE